MKMFGENTGKFIGTWIKNWINYDKIEWKTNAKKNQQNH